MQLKIIIYFNRPLSFYFFYPFASPRMRLDSGRHRCTQRGRNCLKPYQVYHWQLVRESVELLAPYVQIL